MNQYSQELILYKMCSTCKSTLSHEDFHKRKASPDGRNNICKSCANEKTRRWSIANKERKRLSDKLYQQENVKRLSQLSLERYRNNRERVLELAKIRRNRDLETAREKDREKMRRWRLKNKEHETQRRHMLEASRPGQKARRLQSWREANPEKSQALVGKRRAIMRGPRISNLTADEWKFIKEVFGFRCAYCGKKPKTLTQDHVTPLSKGGDHTLSNIVPACRPCNSKKHAGDVLVPVQPLLLSV